MTSSDEQPSRIQREAMRILGETMRRGGIELSVVERELARLDDVTQHAVRAQLTRFFDAIVGLAPGETREVMPGLTMTRPPYVPAPEGA